MTPASRRCTTKSSRRPIAPDPRPRVGMVLYGLDRPLSCVTRTALELGRAMQAVDLCDLTFLTPSRVASLTGSNAAFWRLLGCRRLPALMLLGGPLIALAAKRL